MGVFGNQYTETPQELQDIDYRDVVAYKDYASILCFDNTMHNTYRICPRKFYWSIVRGFEPNRKSSALAFGSAWHMFLEIYLKTRDADTAIKEAIRILIEADANDTKRNPNTLVILADQYQQTFDANEWEVIDTEMFGAIKIGNFIYGAKIDAVIKDGKYIKGIEHKTASMMPANYFDMWRMASQTRGYFNVLKKLLPDARSLIINVAHIVKVPQFHREEMRWSKAQNIDWELTQLNTNIQIKNDFETGIWEQRTESCIGKYGACPFINLCKESCRYQDVVPLKAEFKPRKWEPFHEELEVKKDA